MKFFTKCLFVCLFLIIVFVLIITLLLGHDFIERFLPHLHLLKNASRIHDLLITRFQLLQVLFFVILLIGAVVLFYFNKIYTTFVFYIRDFLCVIATCFRLCLHSEAKYILILPLLTSLWFAVQLPVSYDEAFTYLNFTSKGPIASMFYYPAPNNHILHSLITNVTNFIPFLSTYLCLRISSIVINLLTWCIAYSFLTSYFTKRMALVVVAIASLLYMTIYYSYMSRGYALVSLFFITALYAAFNIIKGGDDKRNWIAFALSSILGFYTMPSFLYAFLTLNAFIFISKPGIVKKQVVVNLLILLITGCLYIPVIIGNGIGALIDNRYVTPLPRLQVLQQLPSFCSKAVTEIVGVPWPVVASLLIMAILVLILKKDRQMLLFYLIFLAAPFVCLSAHAVIPFGRTFIYYNFILVFMMVLPLRTWLEKLKTACLFSALLLIQGCLLWNFNSRIYKEEDYSIVAHRVCKQIIGNKKYVSDDGLFDAHLRFELKANGFDKAEMHQYNQSEMSADTVYGMDYIIIQEFIDKTIRKQPVIETSYYKIYN